MWVWRIFRSFARPDAGVEYPAGETLPCEQVGALRTLVLPPLPAGWEQGWLRLSGWIRRCHSHGGSVAGGLVASLARCASPSRGRWLVCEPDSDPATGERGMLKGT